MHKVFYSWQADTNQDVNLLLVRTSLEEAIRRLDLGLELDEAERESGSKIIFETIREKIESCAIFVPDLTFIGRSHDGRKMLPNSNVLVEYGYALARLSDGQIVSVMNSHFGGVDNLPFDLKHRAVKIIYDASPGLTGAGLVEKREEVVGKLERELRGVLMGGALFKGLSPQAMKIVEHMVMHSEFGLPMGEYEIEELASTLSFDAGETNRLIKQLAARGYVERLGIAGTDSPPAHPTDRLFWDFDFLFKGWNPRKDARVVAEAVVMKNGVNCGALAKDLGWEIRRINPALSYLKWASLVLTSNEITYPLAVSYMRGNERTEGFIAGMIDPELLPIRGGFKRA